MRGVTLLFAASCVAASLVPLRAPRPAALSLEPPFPGWPASFRGLPLVPAAHEGIPDRAGRDRDARQSSFPGRMAQFDLAGSPDRLLVRWVYTPTRKLHPSRHCFRGAGYGIETMDALTDDAGRTWSRFRATAPDGTVSEVREIVFDRDWKASDPDVESWYWRNAVEGQRSPSFWALTWVVPAEG